MKQLYLDRVFQRQGIGSRIIRMLIDEAGQTGKAVTLNNPVRRLYERLDFQVMHEDMHKVHMRGSLVEDTPPPFEGTGGGRGANKRGPRWYAPLPPQGEGELLRFFVLFCYSYRRRY